MSAEIRQALESAHCVEEFSVMVAGATAGDGSAAVILGVIPPDGRGWTFPLPVSEARRVAALLVDIADKKEQT